ncbi:MAG: crotonase/enoyl-CoA hydratase family protein [Marinicellaceae bacterium]
MSSTIITYQLNQSVLTITIDDGNRNVVSPNMLQQLNSALDYAEKNNAVVVLTGRDDVFCAGFDLNILRKGITDAFKMITGGFKLAHRLLAFPTPVIIACNGHAMAMGAFILLSADYRIGAEGTYNITTNEVAIGLTMPKAGIEINRQRLNPAHYTRVTMLSEYYHPQNAIEPGFLDKVVAYEDVLNQANKLAVEYTKLDMKAHRETKMRARKQILKSIKRGIFTDKLSFIWMGIKRALGK